MAVVVPIINIVNVLAMKNNKEKNNERKRKSRKEKNKIK